ncbi:MAG: hypothetical protein ABL982_25060, partial [Vicinamibacterales bacterium]
MIRNSVPVVAFILGCFIAAYGFLSDPANARPTVQSRTAEALAQVTVAEASLADLRTALDTKRVTSVELVRQYLGRIATYEDLLHASLHVNRNAVREAEQLDRERVDGH